MANSADLVAYQTDAAFVCEQCIRHMACETPGLLDALDVTRSSTEELLDWCAAQAKINRAMEGTFDSAEFPKVVLRQHLEAADGPQHCDNCGRELG